jgi:hypothetical protein
MFRRMLVTGRTILILAAAVVFAGCKSVWTDGWVGEPIGTALDAGEYNGQWLMRLGEDTMVYTVKVTDPDAGKMTLGWIEDESDTLTLKTMPMQVRKLGEMKVLQGEVTEKGETRYQIMGAFKGPERSRAILWVPDAEAIGNMVTSGRLRGAVSDDGIRLEGPTAEEMTTATQVLFWSWEEPLFLEKLGK